MSRDAAPPRRSEDPDVGRWYDAAGGRHTADFLSRRYLPGESIWDTMGPGASTHGRLVFDIPSGSALIRLELHLSRTSGGVSIPL